ncbi:MAG: hypothetical protein KAS01_01760 [Candidatus Pacebacteria bacterium]|nr:hypothetical protein [Candidatus Paceibacterota bacterium]
MTKEDKTTKESKIELAAYLAVAVQVFDFEKEKESVWLSKLVNSMREMSLQASTSFSLNDLFVNYADRISPQRRISISPDVLVINSSDETSVPRRVSIPLSTFFVDSSNETSPQEEVSIYPDVLIADLLDEKFSRMKVGIFVDILKKWEIIIDEYGETTSGHAGKKYYLTEIGRSTILEIKESILGKEIEIIGY